MNKLLTRPLGVGILVFLLVCADQAAKGLAVGFLKGQAPFVLWDGVFELHYLENHGAAFGMMQGWQPFLLTMGLAVSSALVFLSVRMSKDEKFWPLRLIMACILAGAVGNMIDRVRYDYVVDFFYFKLIDFPIFNVADIYVSVGTAVLAALIMFHYTDEDLGYMLKKESAP